jgi:hypothetical protein
MKKEVIEMIRDINATLQELIARVEVLEKEIEEIKKRGSRDQGLNYQRLKG